MLLTMISSGFYSANKGCFLKRFSIKEKKNATKKEDDLAER